jgi:hypothetical protein
MIKTTTSIQKFDHKVAVMINEWLKKPERSKALLARLASFRPHSIGDIASGKTSLINYHPSKTLKLLSVLEKMEIAEVYGIYKTAIDEIEKYGTYKERETIDIDLSTNKKFTEDFTKCMQNPVAVAIYTLSLSESGVPESEVIDQFGKYSESILKDLLHKRIIIKSFLQKEVRYFAQNKDMLYLERDQVQKIIPSLNSFYRSGHSGKDRNYISFRIDRINREALRDIQRAYIELEEKLVDILKEESCRGEIPFYCFSQLDTFSEDID